MSAWAAAKDALETSVNYTKQVIAPILERLTKLEERAPVPGPHGEKGEQGIRGEKGETGSQGERGVPGFQGEKGDPGECGERGEKGLPGERGEKGDKGLDGKDGLPGPQGERGEKGDPGHDGKDGSSITIDDVAPLVESKHAEWALQWEREAYGIIERAVDRIPKPRDGKDGIAGEDGKDASVEEIARMVIREMDLRSKDDKNIEKLCKELIVSEVAKIPIPRDGKDGLDGKDGTPGKDGENGKDGVDGVEGQSVTADDVIPTLLEAAHKAIDDRITEAVQAIPIPNDGIDGKDGVDGKSITVEDITAIVKSHQAEWALDFEKRAQAVLQSAMEKIPKPKDGKDGLSADDLNVTLGDDGRTLHIILERDDQRIERTVKLSTMIYREIYKPDQKYEPGDVVTWGGSMWVALKPTNKQPGQYERDWRLAVKKGRDGKDGK